MKLEELKGKLGQEVALSDWIPVTQERVNAFADATGDHQFIHVNPQQAAQGPFGTTIAHGFLTLSLLAGEFMKKGGLPDIQGVRMIVNYGLNRVRFLTPVKVGSNLRNRAVLQNIEPGHGYAQVTIQNTIEIEGEDKPACIAETVFRMYL